ncbi:FGGY-family carbohydrate kinase [Eubacterium barkeri]|uniref:Sugar (Pentulose or hexulose) kinase n=1 Tax=Eubacterium barkeri TaxID=1528 RepID=A0A1H3E0L7_EUBBA|nr:FGGY-family carbohydrate kinase [Eubacterium barkeri]SDX71454.1 Sugar (pentulose or hexulose) kinase [Eubacterium barkeri]
MSDLALTIDCGTKGLRGIIFDSYGNQLATAEKRYESYYSLNMGWVEAPAKMFWDDLCQVLGILKQEEPALFARVAGITVACQRDTGTIVDHRGEALRDFIIWQDRRKLDKPVEIPRLWRILFDLAGKGPFVDSFNTQTHAHWIKVNEPEKWASAHAYVLLSSYLIGKLTGKCIDCRSDIAGHLPFNFKKKEWSGPRDILTQIIRIEREKLIPLVDSCAALGGITEKAALETGLPAGLPVIGSGTDKGCETIGVGCLGPDTASVSLGTQATVEITTDQYFELIRFYPPFPGVGPKSYNPEITVYNGFWMMNWFVETFAQLEKQQCDERGEDILAFLDRQVERIPAGSEGLVLQPYWGMESFKPEALGSIIGLTEGQSKYHIYRAIIEGIGYALREGLEQIEAKSGTRVNSIGLSGGGAQSDVICGIMADIFGRETYRVQTSATTGLGGAMAIFVALGRYEDLREAGYNMIRKTRIYRPDPKRQRLYDAIYRDVYAKAYKRYKPLYQSLKSIMAKVEND